MWSLLDDYSSEKSRAHSKEANDCTENAVELASDYNIALIHDEKQ